MNFVDCYLPIDCGDNYFFEGKCHNFDHFKTYHVRLAIGTDETPLEMIPGKHWSKCAHLCEKAHGTNCKAFRITDEGQCLKVTPESCNIAGAEEDSSSITIYSRTNLNFVGKCYYIIEIKRWF